MSYDNLETQENRRVMSKTRKAYSKVNISIDLDTFDRLEKYCEVEEHARSWTIQKALDMYLSSKGF